MSQRFKSSNDFKLLQKRKRAHERRIAKRFQQMIVRMAI